MDVFKVIEKLWISFLSAEKPINFPSPKKIQIQLPNQRL